MVSSLKTGAQSFCFVFSCCSLSGLGLVISAGGPRHPVLFLPLSGSLSPSLLVPALPLPQISVPQSLWPLSPTSGSLCPPPQVSLPPLWSLSPSLWVSATSPLPVSSLLSCRSSGAECQDGVLLTPPYRSRLCPWMLAVITVSISEKDPQTPGRLMHPRSPTAAHGCFGPCSQQGSFPAVTIPRGRDVTQKHFWWEAGLCRRSEREDTALAGGDVSGPPVPPGLSLPCSLLSIWPFHPGPSPSLLSGLPASSLRLPDIPTPGAEESSRERRNLCIHTT